MSLTWYNSRKRSLYGDLKMITPRVKLETQSFTYFSHNTMKEETVNLNENQLNALREFYVERFVDNMETKDLVQYVTDDMFQYCLLYTSPSPRDRG